MMNTEQLEHELRDALAAHADALPANAGSRICAYDYRPRTRRVHPPVAAGALTAAAVAGAAVWAVSLSSHTSPAFAGWTAAPTAGSSSQVTAAESACRRLLEHTPAPPARGARPQGKAGGAARAQVTRMSRRGGPATSGTGATPGARAAPGAGAPAAPDLAHMRPVLADTRGPFTWAIFAGSDSSASCITGPSVSTMSASSGVSVTAPAGRIVLSSSAQTRTPSGDAYSFVEGRVGSGVTAATLVLDDGTHVRATIQNGWFVAWWPGDRAARSALVTTSTGTRSEALPAHSQPACPPLPKGRGGAATCMSGSLSRVGRPGAKGAKGAERGVTSSGSVGDAGGPATTSGGS